jgi:hypothetical protein
MEQIIQVLDQLDLHSDDPVKVTRYTNELRVRLADFVEDQADAYQLLLEQRDDLLRQLEQICREPV